MAQPSSILRAFLHWAARFPVTPFSEYPLLAPTTGASKFMSNKQSHASICMALGILVMSNSGHVSAQEDTFTSVPHTFESGDVISAEQMNQNFSAIVDAIANIKAATGTQVETGPIGPAGTAGIGIKDAGTFAGSVETATSSGNFSLLPGAGGATGVAAADAACEVNFSGSHAEMNSLALWKSAADGELAEGEYWASSETDVPFDKSTWITSNCDDWTMNTGQYEGPVGSMVRVQNTPSGQFPRGLEIMFHPSSCSSGLLIACYMDQ